MSLLLAGLVGSFAFFAVVPRTKTWFSALGGATLVVYLFHGFFVLGAEFAGFMGWAEDHWPLSFVLVTVLAPLLAVFLAWKPVSSRLNVCVDPVGTFTRRRQRLADQRQSGQAPSSG
jgi:fucose 4-O-acetylase-like acetyltransferase